MPQLVLASSSPWRRKMLENAGLNVVCQAPKVDESDARSDDPGEHARSLACEKARAVGKLRAGEWILGADQVFWDGARIGGKPRDPEQHLAMLLEMRGRQHSLHTGYCVIAPDGSEHTGVEVTTLWVRADLTEAEVRAYVSTGEGSGCAGGYAIEGHGVWLFERIEGDWFNIIGLPLPRVLSTLRALGWRYGAGHE